MNRLKYLLLALVATPELWAVAIATVVLLWAPWANAGPVEKVEDCKFYTTKLVMSRSSGAVGHIVGADLTKAKYCEYNVRLHLGDRLILIESMYDYELALAPTASEKKEPTTQASPASYVEGLNFGE